MGTDKRDQLSALLEHADRQNVEIRMVPTISLLRLGRVEPFLVMEVASAETVVHVEESNQPAVRRWHKTPGG